MGSCLELEDIFAAIGLNENSLLKINDFKNLINKLIKSFRDGDIQILFSFFDKENTGFVKFNKF